MGKGVVADVKWLTIDTSTSTLGVGVVEEKTVIGELATHLKRHHSERLLPTINHLLSETHISLCDLGGIAVVRGPGSYTGVRIGVTTAKILAWSLKIPLVGVSSLAALAVNGRRFPGRLIPMWDARRERVYTGHYYFDREGHLRTIEEDRVTSVKDWALQLSEGEGSFLFLGNGSVEYRTLIQSQLKDRAVFATIEENTIRPSSVGRLALHKWESAGSDDIVRFAPEYLQVTEAESNWERRNRTIKNR